MYHNCTPLIKKRILDFNSSKSWISSKKVALDVAIRRYIDLYDKTFNKYFDLILQRDLFKF